MEAEEGCDFVSGLDVVVADGAFTGVTVVVGFDKAGPVFFDGVGIEFLAVYSKVKYALLHEHSSVLMNRILS